MAYDPAIGKLVLFGGFDLVDNSFHSLSDTWTYDGTTWTQQNPATTPTAQGSMAYDPAIGKLVLFGVHDSGGLVSSDRNEVWSYDGSTWTNELVTSSDGPHPCVGSRCPIVYDAALGKLVCFVSGMTWTYDGTKWTKESPLRSPNLQYGESVAYDHYGEAIAYDPTLGRTVLFGGCTVDYSVRGGQCAPHDGTWTYNGSTWAEQSPSTAPTPRGEAKMVYDSSLKSLVLLGGIPPSAPNPVGYPVPLNDTWTYEPVHP
jgi:hypothetical protein